MKLLDSVVLANDKASELMRIVAAHYSEYHRHYHNWDHIVEGATLFDALAKETEEFVLEPCQELAWLFHDIVYIPMAAKGNNEAMSMSLLRCLDRQLGMTEKSGLFRQADIVDAIRIIMDTINHVPTESVKSKPVLDVDLSGLRDPILFARNTELLQREFGLPRREFIVGQAEFLEKFLQREYIYHTEYARRNWEDKARDNITNFIRSSVAKYPDHLYHLRWA